MYAAVALRCAEEKTIASDVACIAVMDQNIGVCGHDRRKGEYIEGWL